MPATVSVRASESGASTPTANGIGAIAQNLEGMGQNRRETSITFGERSVESLMLLLEACGDAGNDQTTDPISLESYRVAESFLQALPPDVPLPEVMVHPDGEIAFEWHRGKRNVLTVSIGSDGSLAFAALFGVNTIYGRELFAGSIPEAIAHCLARLFPLQAVTSTR